VKKIIYQFASAPRLTKQCFLVLIDLFAFPIILWLCYAIRLFDLGAEVIPGINYGVAFVTIIAILSLMLTGVYRFIVRTFNEAFIAKLAIAVSLMVIVLYGMNAFSLAFVPTSIPLMFGFLMFSWVWCSRAFIRFIVKAALQTDEEPKRIAIYGAGDAGQQIAAVLYRSGNHLPVFFIDDNTSLQDHMVGGLKVLSLEKGYNVLKSIKLMKFC